MPASDITLSTIFRWVNDIHSIRKFYSKLIGLDETFFDGAHGWLNYKIGETTLVFMEADGELPKTIDWARQPGYKGGTVEKSSWVITVPYADFADTVQRLKDAKVATYRDEPQSTKEGHYAFFVRDPMGMTIEIYATTDA